MQFTLTVTDTMRKILVTHGQQVPVEITFQLPRINISIISLLIKAGLIDAIVYDSNLHKHCSIFFL